MKFSKIHAAALAASLVASAAFSANGTLTGDAGDWNDAGIWDIGGAASSGNHYFTHHFTLHTGTAGGIDAFGGKTLTIEAGGKLVLQRPINLPNRAAGKLVLDGGAIATNTNSAAEQFFWGKLSVDANSLIDLTEAGEQNLNFRNGLSGAGHLRIVGDTGDGNDSLILRDVDASGYTGDFHVSEARLRVRGATSLTGSNGVVLEDSAAQLRLEGTQTLKSIQGDGIVTGGGVGVSVLRTDGNGLAAPLDARILDSSAATLGIEKIGGNTLLLTNAANSYTGRLVVSDGTLAIANPGAIGTPSSIEIKSGATFDTGVGGAAISATPLTNNGRIAGDVALANGSVYTGAGTISGRLTIQDASMSIGNSTATSAMTDLTWIGAITNTWELLDANGPAGAGAWDLLDVDNTFDLSAVTSATIQVVGLTSESPDVPGIPANLDFSIVGAQTNFLFAQADSIIGFDPSAFTVDAGNLAHLGTFAIRQAGNTLILTFTSAVPEPGTSTMLLALLAVTTLCLRRRSTAQAKRR